jgi:hypothetical protein
MEEVFKKLLEAEILSPEVKTELETAFQTQLNDAIAVARAEAAADTKAQLTEQFITERDALVEAIDQKVGDFLDSELTELKDDIERFRDLEAEHAEKLVEAKAQMAVELKNDLKELVEKIDSFLEIRLAAEMEELREDLEVVKRNDFGRRLYEAFQDEFMRFVNLDDKAATVAELEKRLEDTTKQLEESEKRRGKMLRDKKLKEVLAPLSGRSRDVMEAILKNVDTEQLDEAYKTFIGRVIRESEAPSSEKEDKVLAEAASKKPAKTTKIVESAVVKTGDTEVVTESESAQAAEKEALKARLQRIAGIR